MSASARTKAGETTAAALLELHELGCMRGGRPLFSGISASVPGGHVLRVRGANGVGKTSLLRMVCGLAQPHHGEVLWQGLSIARLRESFHRQLIYLGHGAALKDGLSAVENLMVATRLADAPCDEAAALTALATAGLRDCEWLPTRMLSHGQRKRAALARLAFGQGNGLWVLDEPFNALDEAATRWLVGAIRLQLARGGIVVLTSHQATALNESGLPEVSLLL
jgi:heme exporter protein A